MKRRVVFLAVVMIILAFPLVAHANAPAPDPYRVYIAVDNYSKIKDIEFLGSVDGENYEYAGTDNYPQITRRLGEKTVELYNKDGHYKSFKLQITFDDGQTIETNPVDFVEWGTYTYNVKKDVLSEGKINNYKMDGMISFFVLFFLILPLGVTVIVEWLLSMAFSLKPGKYVVIINFITNPIMNILLLLIFNNVYLDYSLVLLLLEIFVGVTEYIYYTNKYKGVSKRRLRLFTVAANIASWGIYYLISNWWFY